MHCAVRYRRGQPGDPDAERNIEPGFGTRPGCAVVTNFGHGSWRADLPDFFGAAGTNCLCAENLRGDGAQGARRGLCLQTSSNDPSGRLAGHCERHETEVAIVSRRRGVTRAWATNDGGHPRRVAVYWRHARAGRVHPGPDQAGTPAPSGRFGRREPANNDANGRGTQHACHRHPAGSCREFEPPGGAPFSRGSDASVRRTADGPRPGRLYCSALHL